MTIPTAANYYKLTLNMNGIEGGIRETYNFKQAVNSLTAAILPSFQIAKYRQLLCGGGSAVVNGVISFEQFGVNPADGAVFSRSNMGASDLILGVDNTTPETVVEPYSNPEQGILVEFPTNLGKQGKHLLRMVRSSWISKNQFVPVGVNPISSAAYQAIIAAPSPPLSIPMLFQVWAGLMSDNCAIYKKVGTSFSYWEFVGTNPIWSIIGIGKKSIGAGWPPVKGRQLAFA
jgi:hypothetical protein